MANLAAVAPSTRRIWSRTDVAALHVSAGIDAIPTAWRGGVTSLSAESPGLSEWSAPVGFLWLLLSLRPHPAAEHSGLLLQLTHIAGGRFAAEIHRIDGNVCALPLQHAASASTHTTLGSDLSHR